MTAIKRIPGRLDGPGAQPGSSRVACESRSDKQSRRVRNGAVVFALPPDGRAFVGRFCFGERRQTQRKKPADWGGERGRRQGKSARGARGKKGIRLARAHTDTHTRTHAHARRSTHAIGDRLAGLFVSSPMERALAERARDTRLRPRYEINPRSERDLNASGRWRCANGARSYRSARADRAGAMIPRLIDDASPAGCSVRRSLRRVFIKSSGALQSMGAAISARSGEKRRQNTLPSINKAPLGG